eukprot:m.33905 g.33905  ORF g.33905 m.33905 type:complete len:211 (-) comp5152_c0_seq1:1322-1954(-)
MSSFPGFVFGDPVRVRKTIDTRLLSNIVRHVDAHNKVCEEQEMWRQHELTKRLDREHSKRVRSSDHKRSKTTESTERERSRGRDSPAVAKGKAEDSGKSNYWTQKLVEMEERCGDRWGHAGYKELHPEEFKTDREPDYELLFSSGPSESDEEDSEAKTDRKRPKKSKKEKKKKKHRHSDDDTRKKHSGRDRERARDSEKTRVTLPHLSDE